MPNAGHIGSLATTQLTAHTVREKGPHAYGPHATQKFSMIPKSVQDKIPQWFRPRARRCLGLPRGVPRTRSLQHNFLTRVHSQDSTIFVMRPPFLQPHCGRPHHPTVHLSQFRSEIRDEGCHELAVL